ncbi:DNA topoisomerase type IA zn finger domain-containing protein [Natrialba magadii ATCC 43099]|uniref:DNA topoisomerase type IA zn finger domain-containing protein n=1 Tax=Natrialba magadii (strain ATCC 43099 / DSM 3394 / CCM 3739 / CIP 104546 / IAM 13178 / JCM 8861 / NBRC 102185 / NCIMB 2190 / MS3) TaxID=547559 RepID=L9V959_NATMM|nr:DNA topoisomerase type IA zn finger domain-containing protein [Natrialba magadii ATCC 43099]
MFTIVDRGTGERYVIAAKSADEDVHVNTCESHGSLLRPWLSPHRGISKDKLTQYLRTFQLRGKLLRKPGRKALKHAVKATL